MLGRDARQGRAAHLIALRLPRLARDPQHRRLAAAGIADDRRKALVAGDMRQRPALLGRPVKPPALGRRPRAGHMGVGATMPPVDRQPLGRAFQPLPARDPVPRRDPTLALPLPPTPPPPRPGPPLPPADASARVTWASATPCPRSIASPSAARSNRCSAAIMSRDVNRSSPFPSRPSATSSGEDRTALITWSN